MGKEEEFTAVYIIGYVALLIVSFLIINFVLIKNKVSTGKNNEATDSVSTIDPEQDEKGGNVQKEITMKNLGVLLLVIGGLWLFVSFNMDTTVTTGWGAVNNIGLMDQRRNHLMISGLIIVVGVILLGFETLAVSRKPINSSSNQISHEVENLIDSGDSKFSSGDMDGALSDYKKILMRQPNAPTTHFKIACIYSVKSNSEKSFDHLSKAVQIGFTDFQRILSTKELTFLREQQEFHKFAENGYKFDVPSDIENDMISKLERLSQLKEKGILTQKEFEEQKKKILS
jgi:hypothetical protein